MKLWTLIFILASVSMIAGACIFDKEMPIFSKGLEWVSSGEAHSLETDKFVVNYKLVGDGPTKVVSARSFLKGAEKTLQIIANALPIIPESEKHDHWAPESISKRIQQTAALCALLGKPLLENDNITIQLRTRVKMRNLRAQAGAGNFLLEVILKSDDENLRGYFYIEEFAEFGKGGDWQDKEILFAVIKPVK